MTKEELQSFIESHRDNYGIQLKRHHREMFDTINTSYSFPIFSQKLYHFIHGDKCGKCEICGNHCKFDGIHKGYRKRCSYECMGISKYKNSHEIRECVVCGNSFEIYKKREKTTCSNGCLLKLNASLKTNSKRVVTLKRSLLAKYGVDHPSKISTFSQKFKVTKQSRYGNENYVNSEKCKKTKFEKYGSGTYNNPIKNSITCMERYGVPNVLQLKKNQTNGRRTSKFQEREYEKIRLQCPDAKLEEYLPDVQKSVDIYIPSKKKIVECFGDYWHCNPSKYSPDYYHKYIHMNASEIWQRDKERIKSLERAGYSVEVIWENA